MSSLFGHCHGEKTHFSRNEKRTFSSSRMNNVELARTLSWRENALLEKREKTINSLTYPLVFLQTCPPVNSSTVVIFSVRNLTLWVPFLSTNHQPSRKKSILAQVCFGAKMGWSVNTTKWIFISKNRHLHSFLGYLVLNVVQYGAKRSAFRC